MPRVSDSCMVNNEYFILVYNEDGGFSFEWRFVNKGGFDEELTDVLHNLCNCNMFKISGSLGDDYRYVFFMNVIKESCSVVTDGNGVFVRGCCEFSHPISRELDGKMFKTHEYYGDEFLCEIWDIKDGLKGIYVYLGEVAIEKFSLHN